MTTRGRWTIGCAALVVALAGASGAHAALTTPSCLAKKLKEWGKLRKCQATENGKALQGKSADPAKCQTKFDEKLAKLTEQAAVAGIACRYGVNTGAEAGTVTDYDTGLQWEQKTDDGTVHDKDNTYTWNTVPGGTTPNGTAFTAFLGTLNNGRSAEGFWTLGCFARHCDWRLPAIEELAGIADLEAPGCGSGSPCIDEAVFGPTVAGSYWSASTSTGTSLGVWVVNFYVWIRVLDFKDRDFFIRGVRSSL